LLLEPHTVRAAAAHSSQERAERARAEGQRLPTLSQEQEQEQEHEYMVVVLLLLLLQTSILVDAWATGVRDASRIVDAHARVSLDTAVEAYAALVLRGVLLLFVRTLP